MTNNNHDGILGKISDAAERVKDALSTAPQDNEADNKDRTQTTLSEDVHDLGAAAQQKTNEAFDRVKEAGQDVSDRATQAYKDTKSAVAEMPDRVRDAAHDTKKNMIEHAPGRDTQDPKLAERYGINEGFEAARDYAEKTEDVLGPSKLGSSA